MATRRRFFVDNRLPKQLDMAKIVKGPSEIELLLSQYDHPRNQYDNPREVTFNVIREVENDADTDKVIEILCQISSATLSRDGMLLLAGNIHLEGSAFAGGPSGLIPMIATYDPRSREGTCVVNFTGKGITTIYLMPNGSARIRFDIGKG